MKTLKYSLLVIALAFGSTQLKSQETNSQGKNLSGGLFTMSWQPSIPLDGAKDWIDAGTAAGISFEGLGFVDKNWGIGGEISHNYTYKKYDEKTYNFDSGNFEAAVTGVQQRSVRMLPILLKGFYYFESASDQIKPYVAIGAGVTYCQNDFLIGIHYLEENLWGFSANAEVGAEILFPNSIVGIHTSAKYNYSNVYSTLNTNNNLSRINFNLGLTFLLE